MSLYTMLRAALPVALGLLAWAPPQTSAQELQFADLGTCELEHGGVIEDCRIGYRTVGMLNSDSSNVVLFPTWYGGTSLQHLGYVGPDLLIDSSEFYVIVVDAFGNGVSSSPSNSNSQSGADFPRITIPDMVRHQHRLLSGMGISSVHAVVGISMGGMQAYEWAVQYPDFMDKIVPVVGSPRLDAYDVVLWETRIRLYEWFLECDCQEPAAALGGLRFLTIDPDYQARMTPRDSLQSVLAGFGRATLESGTAWDRIAQSRAMIDHDVAAPRFESLKDAAAAIRAELFAVVGLTDHVVTPGPAISFGVMLGAETLELSSDCGHGVFYCEAEIINNAVRGFLRKP